MHVAETTFDVAESEESGPVYLLRYCAKPGACAGRKLVALIGSNEASLRSPFVSFIFSPCGRKQKIDNDQQYGNKGQQGNEHTKKFTGE